ncbi:MAG: PRC-barrel domain containing protein [Alphaproteobacteria bacterium]|nr:PRC-barrel domain containing protein [Alphaproteobacteria bacterium]
MHTQQSANLDKRESGNLIGSDKVEGTDVYRSNGDHIGNIDRVMIDKYSGKVAYAVMSFGGILGMGKDRYPVPWSMLTYSENLGGYQLDITEQQLKGAPSFSDGQDWQFADRAGERALFDYYGAPPYW